MELVLPTGTGTPSEALTSRAGAVTAGAAVTVTAGAVVGVGAAGDSALAGGPGVLIGIGHRITTVHGGATTILATFTSIRTSGNGALQH